MNYSECLRMRRNRATAQAVSKSLAYKKYDDDMENMLSYSVSKIMSLFELKRTSTRIFIDALLREDISGTEVAKRISNIYNILEKYEYDNKNDMLEDNIRLLSHTADDLNHTLAITSMYGLDETILDRPTVCSRLNDKEIYALTEELKVRGVEVNLDNIQDLFNALYAENHNKKSLYDLVNKYPLTNKALFTMSFMYNQYLSNRESNSYTKTK